MEDGPTAEQLRPAPQFPTESDWYVPPWLAVLLLLAIPGMSGLVLWGAFAWLF